MEEDDRSMITPGKTENGPARNSVHDATSSKTEESILPHYLRASTGSCHDFCKFGRQHSLDANSRRSMPKKKNPLPAKPLSASKSFDSDEKYSPSKITVKREIANNGKPLMVKTRPSIFPKISNYETRPKVNPLTSNSTKASSSTTTTVVIENTRTQRNRDVETGRTAGTSNVVSKKVLPSPKASLSRKPVHRITTNVVAQKHQSRKLPSTIDNSSSRIRKDESEVEEKTLYVIKMETGNKLQFSCSALSHEGGDRDDGENTANEAEFDSFSEIDELTKGTFKKVDSPPPSKLSFRRGRVVEIQSSADNTARKLEFRQARPLAENQKILDRRGRNLKKVEEFESKTTTHDEKSEEKVVFRHQYIQGKKDFRGLLNNVIEEMASKLVETRKSKVKALVGAFETVISLQEIKHSLQ